MRIGFNGRYLQKTPSGIELYLLNLIDALIGMDSGNEFFVFINSQPFESIEMKDRLDRSGAKIYPTKWPSGSRVSRLIWDYAVLGKELGKERIDLFHGPSFSMPLTKVCPSVVTVHDLAFRYFPDSYTPINRYYFKVLLPAVVRRVDMIVTDSESSKLDIVESFPIPDEKVAVVYPGIGPDFKVTDDADRLADVHRRLGISREYILNVSGLITPRKNLTALFKSYSELRRTRAVDHQLVIVGSAGWSYSKIFEMVDELDLREDVIFTGSVSTDDLVAIYNGADLLVFPSWYEGFGFPVLEAMACGTPVVASNISSLPEIGGDACVLVDPADEDELADGIASLLRDGGLRNRLIGSGLHRAKSFSWSETARRTLEVYKRVANG
ncbi:MAG: glycosyltransferase family 4 protein [Actinobacteria bacterium]|nr:glycosyltransferase family 4 protein [Actinomycetota bacterium]